MKVTIKQIAKLADVSIATVSKIVNHKDERISEQTRQRVLKIIDEQGYIPNRVASSMVTKSTKSLGLVVPDIANPFFPEMARGAEDAANQEGYALILCNSDNNTDKEVKYIEMLQEKMVDGIILNVSSVLSAHEEELLRVGIPIVTVDRKIKGIHDEAFVSVNNEEGAYKAVDYMIDRGYKKIVHISGPMNAANTPERYSGYLKAHKARGIELPEVHIMSGEYSTQCGYEAIKELVSNNDEFDSVFCGNDMIAFGAIRALHELGIDVPKDIGVVGFDDIYISRLVTPELTTIRQPVYQLGYKAAELLIKRIQKEEINRHEYILDTELIIRKSTI